MTLRVDGVSFHYGSVPALIDVSFTIERGVTALLGVNGAGKSTLLSICAGLMAPEAGGVSIGSRHLYIRGQRKDALRSVSIMPQSATFPANLTAHDVVTYLGWLKGMSGRAAAKRAADSLALVGLAGALQQRCGSLSGGMKRRVALAQAIVSDPDVILLDEPSTGLDPEQRRGMVELVRGLASTVLLSSHVVEDVEDLAERIMILDGGRLVFDGSATQLTEGIGPDGRRSAVERGFLRAIGREAGT